MPMTLHVLPAILIQTLCVIPVFSLDANFNHGLKGITTTKPLVIAHRGASGVYPEHTIPAYQVNDKIFLCSVIFDAQSILFQTLQNSKKKRFS